MPAAATHTKTRVRSTATICCRVSSPASYPNPSASPFSAWCTFPQDSFRSSIIFCLQTALSWLPDIAAANGAAETKSTIEDLVKVSQSERTSCADDCVELHWCAFSP